MKPDFIAQFSPRKQHGYVDGLEGRTKVFLLHASYRGRQVYYYLQLPSYHQQRFKQTLLLGKVFKPSGHGNILACGYGKPSLTLEKKMAKQFRCEILD